MYPYYDAFVSKFINEGCSYGVVDERFRDKLIRVIAFSIRS